MAFTKNLFLLLLLLISVFISSIDSKVDNSVQNRSQSWNDFDTEFEKIEINRFCDINENCTHSMLCIDNRCRCRPNHKWNRLSKECQSFDCKTNETECQVSDPHRVCRRISLSISSIFGGECVCSGGYIEDRRNQKCRKFCFSNKDCDPGINYADATNNMVCVDFLCQCRPNFKWNITTKTCDAFNCTKDAECWTGAEENRECVDGQCVCNFQEDKDSTKCYLSLYSLFRIRNYKTRKERLLLCTIFIMPSVLLYCLYSQIKKRKSLKLMAKQLETKPTNINYIYLTRTQEMKTSKI